jgi:hypothetical protein
MKSKANIGKNSNDSGSQISTLRQRKEEVAKKRKIENFLVRNEERIQRKLLNSNLLSGKNDREFETKPSRS